MISFSQTNVEFEKGSFQGSKDKLKEAKGYLKEGDKFFELGIFQYENALPFYMKANIINPDNAMLNYRIGLCYLYSNFKWEALQYFQKAYKLQPSVAPDILYYIGRGNHLNSYWSEAIKYYKQYLPLLNAQKEPEKVKDTEKKISECINGMELEKKPVRVFIDNIGSSINSKYADYGPVISADESIMMFTSRRSNSTGGKLVDGETQYFEDVYVSVNDTGAWANAINMGKPINTPGHDATIGLNADGSKLFIYLDDNGDGNIYECDEKGKEWLKPEKLNSNINTKFHESSASISADGKTLYFVSNRKEGGYGGHDIYMSKLTEKGKWDKAENLGNVINTEYEEESVFIHPDGKTLYFSSQGHTSMGGFDIFKSVYNDSTKKWSKPINIGYPVNSPDDDIDFVLSASGKRGYYSSYKKEGYGEKDIYVITFLGAEKQPQLNSEDNLLSGVNAPVKETLIAKKVAIETPQLTILKGVIVDQLSQKPLEAVIELVDNTKNMVIATFKSNNTTGKYLVSLPAGKNYGIAVKCEGYLFHSENFDIPMTASYQEVVKDIQLKNVKVGSKIVLRNIFFDFNKATIRPESTAELERLIKLLNDVPTMKIEISGHTDSKGSDDYNMKLSQSRADAVVKYLIEKGIAKERLTAVGYGETKPIDTNDTDEGRQNNRRTEFEIMSK